MWRYRPIDVDGRETDAAIKTRGGIPYRAEVPTGGAGPWSTIRIDGGAFRVAAVDRFHDRDCLTLAPLGVPDTGEEGE